MVDAFTSAPGGGVTGLVNGRRVVVGSLAFVQRASGSVAEVVAMAERAGRQGRTAVVAAVGDSGPGVAWVVFALADRLRPTSADAVAALLAMGLDVVILSGDAQLTAEAVARDIGMTRVVGGVTPGGKVDEIRRLQAGGAVVALSNAAAEYDEMRLKARAVLAAVAAADKAGAVQTA